MIMSRAGMTQVLWKDMLLSDSSLNM